MALETTSSFSVHRVRLWKAPETIYKLHLPISSTGGSWSVFRFSARLFTTAQLAVGQLWATE